MGSVEVTSIEPVKLVEPLDHAGGGASIVDNSCALTGSVLSPRCCSR